MAPRAPEIIGRTSPQVAFLGSTVLVHWPVPCVGVKVLASLFANVIGSGSLDVLVACYGRNVLRHAVASDRLDIDSHHFAWISALT